MDTRIRHPARFAKVSMPSADGVVIRDRLFRQIDGSPNALWVGAPAGCGKTTLLASYIETIGCPSLWYQVDDGDADPASFFHFLALEASHLAPEAPPLPLLAPEYLLDLPGFARRFFRALYSQLPECCVVVFDNFQEAEDVPAFQPLMRILVEELPPGVRMAFLSRNKPPALLARFSANRKITVIGWDELRLTREETRSLLGPGHNEDNAGRLHDLSQGWAAGLLLLRDLGSTNMAAQAHALEGSPGVLFDYFASEVFSTAPPNLRQLLARTAFFPSFTAGMAIAASGLSDAGEMLDRLAHEHFFVGRHSETEVTYQYHALFRDFLRTLDRVPAVIAKAKRNTAIILDAHGRPEDAVGLFLETGDTQEATAIILRLAPQASTQGRWQTLKRWIDALPADHVEDIPWLLFWRGISELATDPPSGRVLLERAYQCFAAEHDIVGQLLAMSGVMDARFLEWSEFHPLDRWIAIAEDLWDQRMHLPSPAHEIRVVTSMLAAMAYRQPEHPLLPKAARRIVTLIGQGVDPNQQAFSLTQLLQYFDWMADFDHARQMHAIAQRLIDGGRLTPLNEVWARIMIAHGHCIQGMHAPAIQNLALAYEIAIADGLGSLIGVICLARAYTELSAGNAAEAKRQIEIAEARINASRLMDVALLQALRSWLALREGKLELAVEQAEFAVETANATGSPISQVWSRTTLALALGESGLLEAANCVIGTAQALVAKLDKGLFHFHIDLIRADLTLRSGDASGGRELLEQALKRGARSGYSGNLEWLPCMMSRLCTEAIREGIETDYVREIIRRRGLKPSIENVDGWPWPLAIHVLGPFEVLRDGQRVEFSRKTPKKPIALLKALLALGGRNVPEGRLADHIWSDSEADAGREALMVALHRLRKILGSADVIFVRDGRISLNEEMCWVDAWAFERLVGQARACQQSNCRNVAKLGAETAISLYRGDFLATDPEEPWMIPMRERLRARFVQHIAALASGYRSSGRHDLAIALYQRGIDIDELMESFYQELMRCYLELGYRAEGLAVYRRLRNVLSSGHGLAPSSDTEAVLAALLGA